MTDLELESAAERAGVPTSYVSVDGNTVRSSAEAIAAVLAALEPHGHDRHSLDVVVAWDGRAPRLPPGVRVIDDTGAVLDITTALPLGYHLVPGRQPRTR